MRNLLKSIWKFAAGHKISVNSIKRIVYYDPDLYSRIVQENNFLTVDVCQKFGKMDRKLLLKLRIEASNKFRIFGGKTFSTIDAEEN